MWTLTCQLQWLITYWIIITTVVIELLYVNKVCYNKETGLLLWEYNIKKAVSTKIASKLFSISALALFSHTDVIWILLRLFFLQYLSSSSSLTRWRPDWAFWKLATQLTISTLFHIIVCTGYFLNFLILFVFNCVIFTLLHVQTI